MKVTEIDLLLQIHVQAGGEWKVDLLKGLSSTARRGNRKQLFDGN